MACTRGAGGGHAMRCCALAARRLVAQRRALRQLQRLSGLPRREAAWQMSYTITSITLPIRAPSSTRRARSRRCSPSPAITQTETDAVIRQEFRKLAAQTDSALFHDDLALPNDPVYFHEFAAHLDAARPRIRREAKLSMMTAAGLAPRMAARARHGSARPRDSISTSRGCAAFRQSLACRADAASGSRK